VKRDRIAILMEFIQDKIHMWTPYLIGTPPRIRSIHTQAGLGDRLRLVAFAERQAFHAFNHAILKYPDAPQGLRDAWKWVAQEESKHEMWLLNRLEEIGEKVSAVPVSMKLYDSLINLNTAREFSFFISDAEERGRIGAEKFAQTLAARDPVTAEIFAKIADEEWAHIALVDEFFS
jgi:uncharacterized ferritin-like protein (DUF455 family)